MLYFLLFFSLSFFGGTIFLLQKGSFSPPRTSLQSKCLSTSVHVSTWIYSLLFGIFCSILEKNETPFFAPRMGIFFSIFFLFFFHWKDSWHSGQFWFIYFPFIWKLIAWSIRAIFFSLYKLTPKFLSFSPKKSFDILHRMYQKTNQYET